MSPRALFGRCSVHVGVIEWPDDELDVTVIVGSTRDEVIAKLRDLVSDHIIDYHDNEDLVKYVKDGQHDDPWDYFYDQIHEYDQTPWVTLVEDAIEIRPVVGQ